MILWITFDPYYYKCNPCFRACMERPLDCLWLRIEGFDVLGAFILFLVHILPSLKRAKGLICDDIININI